MMKLPPSLAFGSFNHQFDPSHINDKTFSILTARPYLNRIRTPTVKAERIKKKKSKRIHIQTTSKKECDSSS